MTVIRGLLALIITAIAVCTTTIAQTQDSSRKPARIVSLNLCVDELVLRLADRTNIASVTWLSRGSGSNVVELAQQVPINHGLAEEIIPLDPDLVIAGTFTTRTAVALLKRTTIPLAELAIPRSLDDVRRQYREVAALIGEPERGESVVAEIDSRLARLASVPTTARPKAIVLNPNGVTVGEGTLADEVMTRAGLTNVAAMQKIDNYGQVPLETVVTHGVEILILSASRDGPPALATEILKHPVFSRISSRTRLVVMPTRMWACAGPAVVDAIELLSRVANELRDKAAPL